MVSDESDSVTGMYIKVQKYLSFRFSLTELQHLTGNTKCVNFFNPVHIMFILRTVYRPDGYVLMQHAPTLCGG